MLTINNPKHKANWKRFVACANHNKPKSERRSMYDDQIIAMAKDPTISNTEIRRTIPVASGYVDRVLTRALRRGEL